MVSRIRRALPWIVMAASIALLFAAFDREDDFLAGLPGYLALAALGVVLFFSATAALLGRGTPRVVFLALTAAMVLRFAVGIGLHVALPSVGYDTKPQRAGYVYYDAYARDTDAFARGRSDQSLFSAFWDRKSSDQYGGFLFITATIYRYFSGGVHRPLLIVLLASIVSSLAVAFTWGFTGMTLGGRAGVISAWVVALYPDYVLLGSSQMREAFVVPALALVLFGYARARLGDWRTGAWPMVIGIAVAAFVSPPLGLLCLVILGVIWGLEARLMSGASRWLVVALTIPIALTLALTIMAWSNVAGDSSSGIVGLVGRWLVEAPRFQLQVLQEGSGWVQKLFEVTPDWLHMPMAVVYGFSQPFLPAALGDNSGAPIWRAIAVWRAGGWFTLMPVLIYAPFAALTSTHRRRILLALAAMAWAGTLVGSYWAGGDQWDNPRYRAILLPLQAALTAWGYLHARRSGSPWLKRTYLIVLGWSALFLHWYAGRYYGTPRLDLNVTLLVGGLLTMAYLASFWWRQRARVPSTA